MEELLYKISVQRILTWHEKQSMSGTLFSIINTSTYDGPNSTILKWVSISPFWGKASIKHNSESWSWSLGSVESRHTWQFFPIYHLLLQPSNRPSEVGRSVLLLACAWFHGAGKECQTPFILHLFPEHPPETTKVFAHFWEVMHCVFSSVFHQHWRPV